MTTRFQKLLVAHNLHFAKKIEEINNQQKEETMPKTEQKTNQEIIDAATSKAMETGSAMVRIELVENPLQVVETKEQRFSRLANSRMKRLLKGLQVLENLSGSGYAHTPEQAEKIVAALENAVQKVKLALKGKEIEEFKV